MNDLSYLSDLGYEEDEIAEYIRSWNPGIIECLSFHTEYVKENLRLLQNSIDGDLLLTLPIFYTDSFVLPPKVFQNRLQKLIDAFPDNWYRIIELQFYGYEGTDPPGGSHAYLAQKRTLT